MRHRFFSHQGLLKYFSPIITLALFIGFVACNNGKDDTNVPAVETADFVMPDSLWYRGFVLDSQAIASDPRLLDQGNQYTKLLLKISVDDIHGDTLDFGGYIYPARGHGHYGRLEPPINLQLSDTSYRKLRSRLILGNNDIIWRDGPAGWRDVVTENAGGGNRRVRAGIGYLLFIPDDQTGPNCTVCDRHLHFKIKLYNKSGVEIPVAGAGIGDSNPSPPAEPGN